MKKRSLIQMLPIFHTNATDAQSLLILRELKGGLYL